MRKGSPVAPYAFRQVLIELYPKKPIFSILI